MFRKCKYRLIEKKNSDSYHHIFCFVYFCQSEYHLLFFFDQNMLFRELSPMAIVFSPRATKLQQRTYL